MEKEELLKVDGLSISFRQYTRGLRQRELPVINDLSLTVRAGEMTAVVGASGSGKSLELSSMISMDLPRSTAPESALTAAMTPECTTGTTISISKS